MFRLGIFKRYARYGNVMRNGILEFWNVRHFARPDYKISAVLDRIGKKQVGFSHLIYNGVKGIGKHVIQVEED